MGLTIKTLFSIATLVALLPPNLAADFSRSQAALHPVYPGSGPFIIEIKGTWPSDCHPGEQKPVVEYFDGHTVEIGFETIVVHITCNMQDTGYRALVDMSGVVRDSPALGETLRVHTTFDSAALDQTLDLVCPEGTDCSEPTGARQGPDPGLYVAPSLANQGLLVARQNAATAIYPLVYGEAGNSEWLFTADHVVEDTFFSEALRLSGGDCFGCKPSGAIPSMSTIGHLSVLADRPGVLQVKVNDGLFLEYEALVFGYETFPVGPNGEQILIDLEGRWGLSENRGTDPPLGDLTGFLPGAFDISREAAAVDGAEVLADGQMFYRVTSLSGDTLGQLICKGPSTTAGSGAACEFIDPTDAAEPLFLFDQQGPDRLDIEYARPVIAIGTPPGGRAVRLE
jgi:hypothetical protein